MIRSSVETHPFRYICHTIAGIPTRADITLAIEHALQHDDVPILWDLRGVDVPESAEYERQLLTLIDERRLQIPSRRRAFLVAEEHFALAQGLLGELRLSGDWSVFAVRDEPDALRWLGGSD
jgi:hypothetical protein